MILEFIVGTVVVTALGLVFYGIGRLVSSDEDLDEVFMNGLGATMFIGLLVGLIWVAGHGVFYLANQWWGR